VEVNVAILGQAGHRILGWRSDVRMQLDMRAWSVRSVGLRVLLTHATAAVLISSVTVEPLGSILIRASSLARHS